MISFYNSYGKISLTEEYFAQLVSIAAQGSFGVAGMSSKGPAENLKALMLSDYGKGVNVHEEDGRLVIDLNIKVTFGLNIAAAVKSITHKVKYTVEEATGLKVKRINVRVDDVIG